MEENISELIAKIIEILLTCLLNDEGTHAWHDELFLAQATRYNSHQFSLTGTYTLYQHIVLCCSNTLRHRIPHLILSFL